MGTNEPLFILAPPRSFTTVVCAMIGEHPAMRGLPETNLFARDSYVELQELYRKLARLQHGLLRSVAQLGLGGQSAENIEVAKRWLRSRARDSTASLFNDLAAWSAPNRLVEKSPLHVFNRDNLARIQRAFPNAYYLHLLRHPRGMCESMYALRQRAQKQRGRGGAANESGAESEMGARREDIDPELAWLAPQRTIVDFLKDVPPERQMRVRGEDMLADPDTHLPRVATWLGIDSDSASIDRMKHPEGSPFACFGPPNARFGDDPNFLQKPWLRPYNNKAQDLEGPLSWDPELRFSGPVKEWARRFGY